MNYVENQHDERPFNYKYWGGKGQGGQGHDGFNMPLKDIMKGLADTTLQLKHNQKTHHVPHVKLDYSNVLVGQQCH